MEVQQDVEELRSMVIKLENETEELRTEVVRLGWSQESRMKQCSNMTKLLEGSLVMSPKTVVASPFRPPPAPPLPSSPIKSSTRCLKVKLNPRSERERDNSFLEELSKRPPKLRHVELSPGGRPIRINRSPVPNDSSTLTSVLKKRYIALHSSPRLSIDLRRSSPVFFS